MPVNSVPKCTSSNVKTLGLKHVQLPDTGVSSGPPDEARVVHHGTDELLIGHDFILDGEGTPVQERIHHPSFCIAFF